MKRKALKKMIFLAMFSVFSICGFNLNIDKSYAYNDEDSGTPYRVIANKQAEGDDNQGYMYLFKGSKYQTKVYNAIKLKEGTKLYNYFHGMGIDYLYYNDVGNGFSAYTPAPRVGSPLWKTNPGLLPDNRPNVSLMTMGTRKAVAPSYQLLDGEHHDMKKYSCPVNDQSWNNLSEGTYTLKSAPYEGLDSLIGQKVEFRYLGYTEFGNRVTNAKFPSDGADTTQNHLVNWDPEPRNWGSLTEIDQLEEKSFWVNQYLLHDGNGSGVDYEGNVTMGDRTPFYRNEYSQKANVDYWIDKFAVAGDPGVTCGIWLGTQGGGSSYRTVITNPAPKPNLRATWMQVFDSEGNMIGEFKREGDWKDTNSGETDGKDNNIIFEETALRKGETYKAKVWVANVYLPNHPSRYENKEVGEIYLNRYQYYDDKIASSLADTSLSLAKKPKENSIIRLSDVTRDKYDSSYDSAPTHFMAGDTHEFSYEFTVPTGATKAFQERITIPMGHTQVVDETDAEAGMSHDKPSEMNPDTGLPINSSSGEDNFSNIDDAVWLNFNIQPNDLTITSVDFMDEDGNTVTEPIPGNSYKVCYNVKYTGEDMPTQVPVSIKGIAVKTGTTTKDDVHGDKLTMLQSMPGTIITKNVQMKNDDVVQFITDEAYEVEGNALYAKGTVSSDVLWNGDEFDATNNNTGENLIRCAGYNLRLNIDDISPSVVKLSDTQTMGYTINYTVNYDIPNYVKPEDVPSVSSHVLMEMGSNGTSPSSKNQLEEVSIAPGENHFSMTIPDITLRADDYNINWKLTVNPSHAEPMGEDNGTDDPYSDNFDTASTQVKKESETPCSNNAVNRKNDWDVTFHIYKRTGHLTRVCSRRRGCRWVCKNSHSYSWTETKHAWETFEITKANFSSKFEKDKGNDTVDLKAKNGRIKAGYGFSLDIEFAYKTNRKEIQPESYRIDKCNYQTVTPSLSSATMPERIYVVLPDGKVYSNKADNRRGIAKGLSCTTTGSWDNRKSVCKVIETDTFGIKSTNKIYIDEKTKDGTYPLTICTDSWLGYVERDKKPMKELYDKIDTNIEVKGSYEDDIKTHITQ